MAFSLALASGMGVGLVAALGAGLAVYALVLGTSFVSAVGTAVVATVLQIGILVLLPELGLDTPFHTSATI